LQIIKDFFVSQQWSAECADRGLAGANSFHPLRIILLRLMTLGPGSAKQHLYSLFSNGCKSIMIFNSNNRRVPGIFCCVFAGAYTFLPAIVLDFELFVRLGFNVLL